VCDYNSVQDSVLTGTETWIEIARKFLCLSQELLISNLEIHKKKVYFLNTLYFPALQFVHPVALFQHCTWSIPASEPPSSR
jgi:hypothetical protein